MAEIRPDNIIGEIDFRYQDRAITQAVKSLGLLENSLERLKTKAASLDKTSPEFEKVSARIDKLTKKRDELNSKKLNLEFEKRGISEAIKESANLEARIKALKKEVIGLGNDSEKASKKIAEIGKLERDKRGLDDVIGKFQGKGIKEGTQELGGLNNMAGITGKAMKGLGLIFAGFQAVSFIKEASAAAKEIESLAKSFEAFGVAEADALELAKQVDNLGAKVPFEGEPINQAAKQLIKFNVEAKKIEPTILRISAVAKGADVPLEKLAETYGHANQNGIVLGRNFLELYKKVPGLTEAIAEASGRSVQQTIKLGKAGKLTFEEFDAGLKKITESGGKYGEVLTKFQQSTEGVEKAAKELKGDIAEAFGLEFNKGLRDFLTSINEQGPGVINFFSELGRITGALFSAGGALFSGLAKAPGEIRKFIQAIEDGRVSFGGRLFKVDERDGTGKKLTEDMKKILDKSFAEIDAHIEKLEGDDRLDIIRRLMTKTKKFDPTEEQQQQIKEFTAKIRDFINSAQQQASEITDQLDAPDAERALIRKIERETDNLVKARREEFRKLKEEQEKLEAEGIPIDVIQLGRAKSAMEADIKELRRFGKEKLNRAFSEEIQELPVNIHFKVGDVTITKDRAKEIIKETSGKELSDALLDALVTFDPEEAKKKSQEALLKFAKDFVAPGNLEKFQKKVEDNFKKQEFRQESLLARLFGFGKGGGTFDEEKKAFDVQVGLFKGAVSDTKDALSQLSDTYIDEQLNKTDFLISETRRRIDELRSVQEGGNAEQIAIEQKRLDELNEQRAKFQKQQQAINTAQIIANNSVTISEGIKAVATAFGTGNLFTGIATSIALAATIVSTISALNGALGSIPALFEGVERVGSAKSGMKRVFNEGRDDYLTRVQRNERIVPEKHNLEIPEEISNKELPRLVKMGIKYLELEKQQVIKDGKVVKTDFRETSPERRPNESRKVSGGDTSNVSHVETRNTVHNETYTSQRVSGDTVHSVSNRANNATLNTSDSVRNTNHSVSENVTKNRTIINNYYYYEKASYVGDAYNEMHTVHGDRPSYFHSDHVLNSYPSVSQMNVEPTRITVNIDQKESVSAQKETNRLLGELSVTMKKQKAPVVNIKQTFSGEDSLFKKMSK